MAFRPSLVRPPERSPRSVIESRYARQALVRALADRLALLVGGLGEEPVFPPRTPPRENPIFPPRVPPRGAPIIPPRRPVATGPSLPPGFVPPRTGPDYLPTWPPPSARDWVRMPGFYDEDRNPLIGKVEEDGSYRTGAGYGYDPDIPGFLREHPALF